MYKNKQLKLFEVFNKNTFKDFNKDLYLLDDIKVRDINILKDNIINIHKYNNRIIISNSNSSYILTKEEIPNFAYCLK